MTSATASQPRSPKPSFAQVPPKYSMTKQRPPSPASAAPSTVETYFTRFTSTPAASAAAGSSPTARISSPFRVPVNTKARQSAKMIEK